MFVDFSKGFDSICRGKVEQILLAYALLKKNCCNYNNALQNMDAMVLPPDGNTVFFSIVAEVLQGNILASYPFIICQDYVLLMPIHQMKEKSFTLKKTRCR